MRSTRSAVVVLAEALTTSLTNSRREAVAVAASASSLLTIGFSAGTTSTPSWRATTAPTAFKSAGVTPRSSMTPKAPSRRPSSIVVVPVALDSGMSVPTLIAAPLELVEVAVQAAPIERQAVPAKRRLVSRRLRPERRTLSAQDVGRDSLTELAFGETVSEQRDAGATEQIDEARRDDLAARID